MTDENKKTIGRPRNRPPGRIVSVLAAKLPKEFVDNGTVKIAELADEIPCARFTVYRWIDGKPISAKLAKKLVELSEKKKGKLTAADLLPFILG